MKLGKAIGLTARNADLPLRGCDDWVRAVDRVTSLQAVGDCGGLPRPLAWAKA